MDNSGPRDRAPDRKIIRWVTWWPVRYWTDRFNHLAGREGVDLEAVFLAGKSSLLDSREDESAWKFRHRYLRHRPDSTGYYGAKLRLPRPWTIVRGRFDAVIMTYAEASCIAAAVLCWVLRKPYLLFVGNTEHDERKPGRIKDQIKRALFGLASGVVATGPLQRDYALRYVGDEKVHIIGNPVGPMRPAARFDASARDKLRAEFGWAGRDVILYVGRLAPEKDLTTLLDALHRLYGRGVRPKLVLVGSGPTEKRLRARAAELGLEVDFTGFFQKSELAKRYAASDIFVLPSYSEPWGLVVNEAMEFGLPIIASDKVRCAPVLVREGRNGLVFPAGDTDYLASCLEKLCSDKELRGRMGGDSARRIRGHSLEAWAACVLDAVEKASRSGSR